MVSGEAERLNITSAPAAALCDDGGTGTHRSSHISTPHLTPSMTVCRSVLKGTSHSPIEIMASLIPAPEANHRAS